jgi:hypothetical protein
MTKAKKTQKKDPAPEARAEEAASTANTLVRAIRVTPEVLTAAKAYKKEKGVSFYRLGLEAIAERLKREGFLKASGAGVGV